MKNKIYSWMVELFGLAGFIGLAIAAFKTSILAGIVCVSFECFILSYAASLVVDKLKKDK